MLRLSGLGLVYGVQSHTELMHNHDTMIKNSSVCWSEKKLRRTPWKKNNSDMIAFDDNLLILVYIETVSCKVKH